MGGGTPSLFSAEQLEPLFSNLHDLLDLSHCQEITLEANPGTVESRHFQGYRQLGINRISLGVQSFNTTHLKTLGRIHSRDEAIKAFAIARQSGFDNINIDLMFGLPEQTPAELDADIEQALALEPNHISYYQLTLEPNTLFAKQPPPMPDDEQGFNLQQQTAERLQTAGYGRYEISNYSRQQPCQHNLHYWQYHDYLGIGAGAHGKISVDNDIYRTLKHKHPRTYMTTEQILLQQQTVAKADRLFEFILNQLRLYQAGEFATLYATTGLAWADIEAPFQKACKLGLMTYDSQHFQPTERGYLFLNDLQELFLP